MNRKGILGAAIAVLICVCAALSHEILDPTRYTGIWYQADTGSVYVFEEGLIRCAEKELLLADGTEFSGSYCFAKDKAALFVMNDQGAGEVVELHLVHKSHGDVLFEHKDGKEIPLFFRNPDSVKQDR